MALPRPSTTILTRTNAGMVVVAILLFVLAHVLIPFVLGLLFAYIGQPLVRFLTNHKLPNTLAASLVLSLFLTAIALLGLLIVPMLHNELKQVFTLLPATLNRLSHTLPVNWLQLLGLESTPDLGDWTALVQNHWDQIQAAAQKLLGSARAGGAIILELGLTVLLVPVVTFYLLKDWGRVWNSLGQRLDSTRRHQTKSLLQEIDQALGQYLRGQAMVMLVMAGLYAGGLYLVGLHAGLAIGALSGLLVFIPYLGVFTGFTLALLAALVQGPGLDLLAPVLAVYGLGHLLEGSLVTPRWVGERIGLHPLVVILALLSFGHLFGFLGVVIALPISAVLRVLLDRWRPLHPLSEQIPSTAKPPPAS